MKINDQAIEANLKIEMEGKVYQHVYVTNMEDTFYCSLDFYTVKGGVVFVIEENKSLPYDSRGRYAGQYKLTASGDTLFDLKRECVYYGPFNEGASYKSTRATLTQKEVISALGLNTLGSVGMDGISVIKTIIEGIDDALSEFPLDYLYPHESRSRIHFIFNDISAKLRALSSAGKELLRNKGIKT